MIEYSLNPRIEQPRPTKLDREVRVPMSLALVRKIQLDCLKMIKKGGK